MAVNLLALALAAPGMPSQSAKLALITLCDAADPDGTNCYPSIARVARNSLLKSSRQARRIVGLFRDAVFKGDRRLLTVIRDGGGNHPTEYRIDVSLLADLAVAGWDDLVVAVPGDAGIEREAESGASVTDDRTPDAGVRGVPVSGEDIATGTPDISGPTPDTRESANPSPNPPSRPVERERTREAGGKPGDNSGGNSIPEAELLDALRKLAPTTALDGRVATEAAWGELAPGDRAKAVERYPGWLALAQKGGRKIIAGLPAYLRERRFDFVDQAKGQAAGGEGEAPAVFFDAFSRPWWHLVHGFLEANRDRLGDVRGPAARELKRLAELAVMGIGYRLKKPEKKAELEAAAEADLVAARKSDPAVKAWIVEWQRQGVRVPLPDQVEWVFMPRAILDRLAPQPSGQTSERS